MIRFGNSSFSPDLTPSSRTSAPARKETTTSSTGADQVDLSTEAAAIPAGRSEQIEALRALYAQPDYLPASLPTSRKLVAAALLRG